MPSNAAPYSSDHWGTHHRAWFVSVVGEINGDGSVECRWGDHEIVLSGRGADCARTSFPMAANATTMAMIWVGLSGSSRKIQAIADDTRGTSKVMVLPSHNGLRSIDQFIIL